MLCVVSLACSHFVTWRRSGLDSRAIDLGWSQIKGLLYSALWCGSQIECQLFEGFKLVKSAMPWVKDLIELNDFLSEDIDFVPSGNWNVSCTLMVRNGPFDIICHLHEGFLEISVEERRLFLSSSLQLQHGASCLDARVNEHCIGVDSEYSILHSHSD